MKDAIRRNILILDPDRDIGELFARALEARRDARCYLCATEADALEVLKDIRIDLILLDLGMAMAADFGLLRKIRRTAPDTVIVVDAYLHQKTHLRHARDLGATGCITKPVTIEQFRKQIDEFYLAATTTSSV
jgi:DNA-binding response OmpR family regulator